MNDNILPAAQGGPSPISPGGQSGGAMLRLAREAQGLHIAALAAALKVPVKKLVALEAGSFDLLPDIVFVRALAASVCRTLKIDPEPILAALPHASDNHLKPQVAGMSVPFSASTDGMRLPFWAQFSKPVLVAVLLLLAGGLLIFFLPFLHLDQLVKGPKSEVVSEVFQVPAAVESEIFATTRPASSGDVVSPPTVGATRLSDVPAPSNLTSKTSANGVPSAAPVPSTVTSTVVFKSRGVSWVEVVDASGIVQLRKNLANGEIASVTGAIPISIVVGRADSIDVEVRGKPFDMAAVTKDNVARFEVK